MLMWQTWLLDSKTLKCLDVVEVKMDETEMQSTSNHKEVTKHELKYLAKILRIHNMPFQKNVIYNILAGRLAPVFNILPMNWFWKSIMLIGNIQLIPKKAKIPLEVFISLQDLFKIQFSMKPVTRNLRLKAIKLVSWRKYPGIFDSSKRNTSFSPRCLQTMKSSINGFFLKVYILFGKAKQ